MILDNFKNDVIDAIHKNDGQYAFANPNAKALLELDLDSLKKEMIDDKDRIEELQGVIWDIEDTMLEWASRFEKDIMEQDDIEMFVRDELIDLRKDVRLIISKYGG